MAIFSITEILKEARRRRVFRVAALYVVAAWVFLQVTDLAFPAFDIPDSALIYVWLGALLVFPIAITFAWRYDVVGSRIVRTPKTDDKANLPLRQTDYMVLASLTAVATAIVIGLVGEISEKQSSVSSLARSEDADPASIAVLPFVNMSPDPDNAYFADGVSEELLNGLAKVQGLRVTARTSSFSFRNQNLDIRQIGQKLGVANILEGSIRVADETIRVTAQLIDSESGIHRWSETYDRSMNDIFSVQDDISKNIVSALKENLDIDDNQQEPVVGGPTSEAYRFFLQGRASAGNFVYNDNSKLKQAIEYFNSAVDADPTFSDAFVALAHAYIGLSKWHGNRIPVDQEQQAAALKLAKDAGNTALELAPQSSETMRALGMISDDTAEKERAFRKAISINTNNADAYRDLGYLLLENGVVEEGAEMARRSHKLDPLDWQKSELIWLVLTQEGKLKEASIFYQISNEQSRPSSMIDEKQRQSKLKTYSELPVLPDDLDFEDGGGPWHFQKLCEGRYAFSISDDAYSGQRSGLLESLPGGDGWCPTRQTISAKKYLGKYVRLVGMVKANEISDHANLYINVLDVDGSINYADRWPNFIKKDTDWLEYELRIFVPMNALVISFGVVLQGAGRVWVDDIHFETFDEPEFK